jgi:hypothetical protein
MSRDLKRACSETESVSLLPYVDNKLHFKVAAANVMCGFLSPGLIAIRLRISDRPSITIIRCYGYICLLFVNGR